MLSRELGRTVYGTSVDVYRSECAHAASDGRPSLACGIIGVPQRDCRAD